MTLQTILVGIDFSPESTLAQEHAFHLASATGADVHLLHVLFRPIIPPSLSALPKLAEAGKNLEDAQVAEAQSHLEEVTAQSNAKGLSLSSTIGHGEAAQVLIDTATQTAADLIVTGTHGRTGFRRLRLGSVAESVAHSAPCSVLVTRTGKPPADGYHDILVPTDFSETAERALEMATKLVAPGGTIRLLHLWVNPFEAQALYAGSDQATEYHQFIESSVQKRGSAIAKRMREKHPTIVFEQRQGNPAESILDDTHATPTDLVVMGASSHRLGGVARAVVRHADSSVLVVR